MEIIIMLDANEQVTTDLDLAVTARRTMTDDITGDLLLDQILEIVKDEKGST